MVKGKDLCSVESFFWVFRLHWFLRCCIFQFDIRAYGLWSKLLRGRWSWCIVLLCIRLMWSIILLINVFAPTWGVESAKGFVWRKSLSKLWTEISKLAERILIVWRSQLPILYYIKCHCSYYCQRLQLLLSKISILPWKRSSLKRLETKL